MTGNTNHPGRRRFMLGAGAAALAPLSSLLGSTAIAAGRQKIAATQTSANVPPGAEYDVIVIGGGFAGLTAARDCALRGLSTLLIEARNRVGGRTFTADYGGKKIELGGTWIHWSQGYVWQEVNRYGLTLAETPGAAPDQAAWFDGGRLRRGPAGRIWGTLAQAMQAYCNVDGQDGRTVFPRPYEPLRNRDLVARYDRMSLQDRLGEVRLPPLAKELLAPQLAINCHNALSQGAFVEQLRWWALGDYDMGRLFEKLGRYKIAEGTTALAHAMLGEANVDLLLSTPVNAVETANGRTTVTTAHGNTYLARAVICAVPMNVLSSIALSPPLAPAAVQASRTGHSARGVKCYIHIRQKVGEWMGMAAAPYPITLAWTEQERDDGTLLVCFGPPGGLDVNDDAQVQKALRGLLPGADVIAVTAYDWTDDPFSRGTWCWYRPGQLTTAYSALREPAGGIVFASADSAMGWRGFIDGAIESGAGAAYAVTQKLKA